MCKAERVCLLLAGLQPELQRECLVIMQLCLAVVQELQQDMIALDSAMGGWLGGKVSFMMLTFWNPWIVD